MNDSLQTFYCVHKSITLFIVHSFTALYSLLTYKGPANVNLRIDCSADQGQDVYLVSLKVLRRYVNAYCRFSYADF